MRRVAARSSLDWIVSTSRKHAHSTTITHMHWFLGICVLLVVWPHIHKHTCWFWRSWSASEVLSMPTKMRHLAWTRVSGFLFCLCVPCVCVCAFCTPFARDVIRGMICKNCAATRGLLETKMLAAHGYDYTRSQTMYAHCKQKGKANIVREPPATGLRHKCWISIDAIMCRRCRAEHHLLCKRARDLCPTQREDLWLCQEIVALLRWNILLCILTPREAQPHSGRGFCCIYIW